MFAPRTAPRTLTVRAVLGLAALALLGPAVAACGADAGTASSDRAPTSTSDPTPTSDETDPDQDDSLGPPAPDETDGEGDITLAWVPLGPTSPNDPPEQRWYPMVDERDCTALRDAVADEQFLLVWPAAATVCEAMQSGSAAQWSRAEAEVAALGSPDNAGFSCLDAAVHRALIRAVAFHLEHPDVAHITTTHAEGTACPLTFEGLWRETPPGAQDTCEGTWLLLLGRLLPSSIVSVDGVSTGVRIEIGPSDRLYLLLPAKPVGAESVIEVSTADGESLGSGPYAHEAVDGCPTANGADGDDSPDGGDHTTDTAGDDPSEAPTPDATPDPTP